MRVQIGSSNVVKAEAARQVFARLYPQERLEVRLTPVESGVPEQPLGDQVAQGARQRARQALGQADYGVGIEAGLIWNEVFRVYFDVQLCAILDRAGRLTVGHGAGFVYPPEIIARVQAGRTVGEAMAELSGIEGIGHQMGAIGYLSHGWLDRTRLTEQAVLMALVPRIRAELYPGS